MRGPLKTRDCFEVRHWGLSRVDRSKINTHKPVVKVCLGPPGLAAPCGCGVFTKFHNLVLGVRRVCASVSRLFSQLHSRAVPGSTGCRVCQYLCLTEGSGTVLSRWWCEPGTFSC